MPLCEQNLKEIVSILNAALRRKGRLKFVHPGSLLPRIEYKELLIDPLRRQVRMRGKSIELTPKEFDLLHLLANSPGVVLTKEQIYSHIWKAKDNLGISTVSDHISSQETVIRRFYFERRTWSQTAQELNVVTRTVYKIRNRALDRFEAMIPSQMIPRRSKGHT